MSRLENRAQQASHNKNEGGVSQPYSLDTYINFTPSNLPPEVGEA